MSPRLPYPLLNNEEIQHNFEAIEALLECGPWEKPVLSKIGSVAGWEPIGVRTEQAGQVARLRGHVEATVGVKIGEKFMQLSEEFWPLEEIQLHGDEANNVTVTFTITKKGEVILKDGGGGGGELEAKLTFSLDGLTYNLT